MAGGSRVLHLRQVVGQAIDDIVGFDARLHERNERSDVAIGQRQAHLAGDFLQLVWGGSRDGHGFLLWMNFQMNFAHGMAFVSIGC
jgi:hypothetical protein